MANPEHLEILKQGAEAWNRWREANPEIRPDLNRACLAGGRLGGADLSVTHLVEADLSKACLRGANLRDAHMGNANLRRADCAEARLSWANLSWSNLGGANLGGALLDGANLISADIAETNFAGATMGMTIFEDNDLSHAGGLESVRHLAPSVVSVDMLYRSKGKIPVAFLRGCGVPEDFITYMRSLTAQPIQFHTCFISFTEADDPFSERLYNDLQSKGVRCWRWKEDAKWGKTLMRSIDEAVRVYDKLIVVCSEQSLNSPAVIREIERALQKEDEQERQGKDAEVLFPIRLDDYIFTNWEHHRKADVIAKTVGDFRTWKSHDDYRTAFDRLLRDLKAGA